MTTYLIERYQISERRACRVTGIARSTFRDPPNQAGEQALLEEIYRLSYQYERYGYRKIYALLKQAGWRISRERLRQLRKREGLQVRVKQRKKRCLGQSTTALHKAEYPNHVWSYDFMFDTTWDGRTLKFLNVYDEFTQEGLIIQVARSITSNEVIRTLKYLFELYGAPKCIKSDNGPEFVAKQIQKWLKKHNVKTRYIDPGKPWQNGYVEGFNAVFRDGCLNRWQFYSIAEARRVSEQWLEEYNTIRPHGGIGMMTPRAFAKLHRAPLAKAA